MWHTLGCGTLDLLSNWGSPVGLFLDFIGVLLLGIDLVRVQQSLRAQARSDLARFEALAEYHGGTEGRIEEIATSTRRIEREYDPGAFNMDDAMKQIGELTVNLGRDRLNCPRIIRSVDLSASRVPLIGSYRR